MSRGLCGTQRRGETLRSREVARQSRQLRKVLPARVEAVRIRGDGEFLGGESVQACQAEGFAFTFGNRRCAPPFPEAGWYRHGGPESNACLCQPAGWEESCRFVAMRIRKARVGDRQLRLVEHYVYREFPTTEPGCPHRVIEEYDRRAMPRT